MVQLKGRTVATLVVTLTLFLLLGILFKLHYSRESASSVVDQSAVKTFLDSDFLTTNSSNENESLSASLSEAGSATNSSGSNEASSEDPAFDIDDKCLQYICMEATGCRPSRCAKGKMCGIYRISERYWIDAGRPKVLAIDLNNIQKDDHELCVTDDDCASRAVKAYMQRYARDCDSSGKIDCEDFKYLHILGPTGCLEYSNDYFDGITSNGFSSSPESEQNYSYEWD